MSGDEERLSDYLDGRLEPGDRASFEVDLASDPDLARRLGLLRAMRAALARAARPMPADLKAALMREARARAPRPSWLDPLRESFASRLWAYGAGAAFAAAGLTIILRIAQTPAPIPVPPVAQVTPDAPPPLADLWTDDDGGDEDEG